MQPISSYTNFTRWVRDFSLSANGTRKDKPTNRQESEADVCIVDGQCLVLSGEGSLACHEGFRGKFFGKFAMKYHVFLVPKKKVFQCD